MAKNKKKQSNKERTVDAGRAETEKFQAGVEVQREFDEAALRGAAGNRQLIETLREDRSPSSELHAGDVDASADDNTGEETVGGDNPTPDQSVVEEIGKAEGLTYEDNEPLRPNEKIEERDRNRWELDPASAEDYKERLQRKDETG
jgi:hypothetical protein